MNAPMRSASLNLNSGLSYSSSLRFTTNLFSVGSFQRSQNFSIVGLAETDDWFCEPVNSDSTVLSWAWPTTVVVNPYDLFSPSQWSVKCSPSNNRKLSWLERFSRNIGENFSVQNVEYANKIKLQASNREYSAAMGRSLSQSFPSIIAWNGHVNFISFIPKNHVHLSNTTNTCKHTF